MLRGGAWGNANPGAFRCAYRLDNHPDLRNHNSGFRVARTLTPGTFTPSRSTGERSESAMSLRIVPIPPQTIEAGKQLTVAVSVENAQRWNGQLQFSLQSGAVAGAVIQPATGAFAWTPATPGSYQVVVSVEELGGQLARTSFLITVTRPSAKVKAITKEEEPDPTGTWRFAVTENTTDGLLRMFHSLGAEQLQYRGLQQGL